MQSVVYNACTGNHQSYNSPKVLACPSMRVRCKVGNYVTRIQKVQHLDNRETIGVSRPNQRRAWNGKTAMMQISQKIILSTRLASKVHSISNEALTWSLQFDLKLKPGKSICSESIGCATSQPDLPASPNTHRFWRRAD